MYKLLFLKNCSLNLQLWAKLEEKILRNREENGEEGDNRLSYIRERDHEGTAIPGAILVQ